MSVIATAVKHLMSAGVTGDALLAAIAELEMQVRAEPKPRSAGAERTKRWRERHQASPNVTCDTSDVCDAGDASAEFTSLSRPPNENNSNPPTHTHPEGTTGASDPNGLDALPDAAAVDLPASTKPKGKGKRAAAVEVPMPEGWEPILTPAAQKIVDGWPPGMFDRELMAFEAHAAKHDRMTRDWQAAFRTWIARADRDRQTEMTIEARALGEVLPAPSSLIGEMGLLNLSTTQSPAGDLAPRLSNDQLASALVVAAAPLPALEMADARFLAQILRMMDVLPRRAEDTVGGKLRHRAYGLTIGRYPRQALQFLAVEALRTAKFFPSTSECVEIMARWQRDDHAVKEKLAAGAAARRERQARFDETLDRLARGECGQAEIDALDEWTKDVAETRGHLRREGDGTYTSRVPTSEGRSDANPASEAI